jgi:hypothetical protein
MSVKPETTDTGAAINAAALPTRFITPGESAQLSASFDLTADEMAQVAGGTFPWEVCQCVNCCGIC